MTAQERDKLMAHAINGYCDIYTDNEGTATILTSTLHGVCNPRVDRPLQGCLHEGVYDVDGERCCVEHLTLMLDLALMVDRYADVRFIGE